MLFAVVYAQLRSLAGVQRHWLPWLVLGTGLLLTLFAASRLLTTVGSALHHEDIARRRGRELAAHRNRTEQVLARIRDAVVVTDARGAITEWNDAAVRTFDRSPREALGRHCAEILGIHAVDRPLDCHRGCALLRLTDDQDDAIGVEVLRDRGDGTVQPLLANVGALRDDDGGIVEIVHSLRDITRLRAADDAKTMFLATTSHELRTPLAVIKGFVETLRNHELDPDTRDTVLATVQNRVDQLTDMVEGLLKTSRLERGQLAINAQPVDIAPTVRAHVEDLRATTERDVTLTAPDGEVAAWADLAAVATIVDHLVENAIKYSPDGGPIEVTLTPSADGAHVTLVVRDEGIGMDEHAVAHCFDRFWQAEQGDDRRFGGTGVGLYLVRSLVEAMAGDIRVESRPGEGSTFTVVLGTAPPDDDDQTAPPAGPERGRSLVGGLVHQTGVPTP